MANARREVDLVVKAKDDAAKVIDAITDAFNNLIASQQKLSDSTKKTGGGIGNLVAAVSDLNKVLRGGSGADKLAADLDKATKAVAGLKQQLDGTEGELTALKQQATAAATATAKLKTEVNGLEKELAQQNTQLKAGVAAHGKLKGEMAAQEAVARKLTRSQTSLTSQIERQKGRIGETTEKFQQLGDQIAQAETPSKRLQQSFAQTETKLQKQTARLAELEAKLAETGASLQQAAESVTEFGVKVANSAADLEKQRAGIVATKTALSDFRAQASEAAAGERELEANIEKVEAALDRQKVSLESAEKSYASLGQSTEKAQQGMAELAAAARGPLAQAISAQRGVVSQINQEFQKVRGELAQVAAQMDRVGVPTKEMSDEYQRLRASLKEIEAAFGQQRAVFGEMRAAYSGLTGDTAELTTVTNRFDQALKESSQTLQRVQSLSNSAAGSMGRIKTETQEVAVAGERASLGIKEIGTAASSAATRVNSLSQAYRGLYGETRQALSYTQRLRGEVLSLISAYGGVFGVIQALTGVVNATQKVEAAQVRLGALFDGDMNKAGEEFDFVRRTADRLGIDIGELADQYTKFAAATKNTSLEGEKTREVFMRIAEAGRVNNLEFTDMQGIFRAVVQIASKGKVQLEELQGQLGDRLPGALQIMADGLGITVAELQGLTKEGSVSASALANFADELEKRYGDRLPDALKTTAASLGRFQNAVTQALLSFGQGGFIEGFNQLLESMTKTLKSADFRAFAQNVSAAFGLLAKTLALVADNFKLVVFAANAFLAVKLLPIITGLLGGFGRLTASINAAQIAAAAFRREQAALGVTTAATAGRVGILGAAMRGLGGGPAGVAIAAVVGVLTYWLTTANEVNEAMTQHESIMNRVKGAYDQNKKSVEEWRKELALVSTDALLTNIKDTKSALETLTIEKLDPLENLTGSDLVPPEIKQLAQQIQDVTKAFLSGDKSVEDYAAALNELSTKADALGANGAVLKGYIEDAIKSAEADEKVVKAVREAEDALKVKTGTTEEATAAMKRLTGATEETKESQEQATKAASSYKSGLDQIKEAIPGLAEELKKLKELADLEAAYQSTIRWARSIGEATQAFQLYQAGIQSINSKYAPTTNYGATRNTPAAKDYGALVESTTRLAKEMNLSVEDLLTAIHYESGFDPNIMGGQGKNYFGLFQASPDVRQQYGIGPGSTVQEQVAAFGKYLKDRGVMPGDNLLPIYAAINAGNAKYVNRSDEANGGLPGTVADKVASQKMEQSRKEAQALLEAYGGIQEKAEQNYETETKRAEKLAEMKLTAEEDLQLAEVEKKFKDADLVTRTTELELEKARIAAKREGGTLDAETEAAIRRRVELQEREKSNQDQINTAKQAAEQAEARFNALVSQRESLLKQATAYTAAGNTQAAAQATQQANALKASMDAAAQAAIAMWQKIGGPEAQAAIEKIRLANVESQNLKSTGNQLTQMWTAVGQSLMDNLSTAVDEFAQAVANGENAWKALGRALQKAAAQFLIDIGKMIIKQMLFNMLSGIFPGLANPLGGAVAHTGTGDGTIGSNIPNRTRSLDSRVFARAPRFHKGYQAGISSKEMPAVLEKTEAVMTAESPFHPNNQAKTLGAVAAAGAAGGGQQPIRIINAIDSASVLEEALNTPAGERAILNHYRKNKASFKEVMS